MKDYFNHDNDTSVTTVFDDFKTHGMNASFHYADDTASGEWRLGAAEEAKALKIFDGCPPEYQEKMREIARGFLWSLASKRPITHEPTDIDEFRKLPDGTTKNTRTGFVEESTTRQLDDISDDLPSNNGRY